MTLTPVSGVGLRPQRPVSRPTPALAAQRPGGEAWSTSTIAAPTQGALAIQPRWGALSKRQLGQLVNDNYHPDAMTREVALWKLYQEPELTDTDTLRALARQSYFEDIYTPTNDPYRVRLFNRQMLFRLFAKNLSPWGVEASIIHIREAGNSDVRQYSGQLLKASYPKLPQWLQDQTRARLYDWIINNGGFANEEAGKLLREHAPARDIPFLWHLLTRQDAPAEAGLPEAKKLGTSASKDVARILVSTLVRENTQGLAKLWDYLQQPETELRSDVKSELVDAFKRIYDLSAGNDLLDKADVKGLLGFLPTYEEAFVEAEDAPNRRLEGGDYMKYLEFKRQLLRRGSEADREAAVIQHAHRVVRHSNYKDIAMIMALSQGGHLSVEQVYDAMNVPTREAWEVAALALSAGIRSEYEELKQEAHGTYMVAQDQALATYEGLPAPEQAARRQQVAVAVQENPDDMAQLALLLNMCLEKPLRLSTFALYGKIIRRRQEKDEFDYWYQSLKPAIKRLAEGKQSGAEEIGQRMKREVSQHIKSRALFLHGPSFHTSNVGNSILKNPQDWDFYTNLSPLEKRLNGFRPNPTWNTNPKPIRPIYTEPQAAMEIVRQEIVSSRIRDLLARTNHDDQSALDMELNVLQENDLAQSSWPAAMIKSFMDNPTFIQAFIRTAKPDYWAPSWRPGTQTRLKGDQSHLFLDLLNQITPNATEESVRALGGLYVRTLRVPFFRQHHLGAIQDMMLEKLATMPEDTYATRLFGQYVFNALRFGVSKPLLNKHKETLAKLALNLVEKTWSENPLGATRQVDELEWHDEVGLSNRFSKETNDSSSYAKRMDTRLLLDLIVKTGCQEAIAPFTRGLFRNFTAIRREAYADENVLIGLLRRPDYLAMATKIQDPATMGQLANMLVWYKIFEAVPPFLYAASQQMKRKTQMTDPVNLEALTLSLSAMGYLAYPDAKRALDKPASPEHARIARQFLDELKTPNFPTAYFAPFPVKVPFLAPPEAKPAEEEGTASNVPRSLPVAAGFLQRLRAARRPEPPNTGGALTDPTADAPPAPTRGVRAYIAGLVGEPPAQQVPNYGQLAGVQEAYNRYIDAPTQDQPRALQTLLRAATRYRQRADEGLEPFANQPDKTRLAERIGECLNLSTRPEESSALLSVLAALSEPSVSEPVINLLSRPGVNESLVQQALTYLVDCTPRPEAVNSLKAVFNTPTYSTKTKSQALQAISVWGTLAHLQSLYTNNEPLPTPLKLDLLEAVARQGYGNVEALAWMLDALESASSPEVKAKAVNCVGLMTEGDVITLHSVITRIWERDSAEVKLAALQLLDNRIWSQYVREWVVGRQQDPDYRVRRLASQVQPEVP